ncbi:hypothetical protein Tco_1170358 [Tanacetum coccineum]
MGRSSGFPYKRCLEHDGTSNEELKSRCYGPFTVSRDMKGGAIELCDEEGNEFIVNKQRVKLYQKDISDFDADKDITLEDEGGVTNFSNKENIFFFADAGDGVRINPDGVASPATAKFVIFDKEKPKSS